VGDSFYLRDAASKLARLRIKSAHPALETEVSVVADEVRAVAPFARGIRFVGRGVQGQSSALDKWRLVTVTDRGEEWWNAFEGSGTFEAFFGAARRAGEGHGAVAIEEEIGRFTIRQSHATRHVVVQSGRRVVGLANAHVFREPSLVVLDNGRVELGVLSESGVSIFRRAESPVERICVSPLSHHIAYTTRGGELVVLSLNTNQVLWRSRHGEPT
jgi:hypothetical protein